LSDPENATPIVRVAAVVQVVVQVAAPVVVFTATVPQPVIVVEFAVNATVPASGAGVTVAVIVTDWPAPEGFGDMVNVVVVEARFTTWDSDDDVDVA
jgi:hypothetical protein